MSTEKKPAKFSKRSDKKPRNEAPPPPATPTFAPPPMTRSTLCEAVFQSCVARGLTIRESIREAEAVADRLRVCGDATIGGLDFYDLRSEQDYDYPGGANKVLKRGNSVVKRDPSEITTLVVHQAGIEFGVSDWSIKMSGGDIELARARRALDVACHCMAFRTGHFVAAHPLEDYVHHAGRLNGFSLGLEIDGRYPGLMDRPNTIAREDLASTWGDNTPTKLTDRTVDAACRAAAWMVMNGRKQGMPLTKVMGHRQSSDTRRSDPGEEIWRRVVLDFIVGDLGLIPDRESPWNQGYPIPIQWDDDGIGDY